MKRAEVAWHHTRHRQLRKHNSNASDFPWYDTKGDSNRTARNTIPWPCNRKDEDAPGTHNSEGHITYYRTPIALENNMPCLAPTTSRTTNVPARCWNKFHHGQSSHENLRTLSHTLKWYNGTFWNPRNSLTKMIHSLKWYIWGLREKKTNSFTKMMYHFSEWGL